MTNQPMDIKDSSAKFLPITTQLIAVNLDIAAKKEKLSRLNNDRNQLAIMGSFLSQAQPVVSKNFDGLSAVAELMQIEASLRKSLQPSDLSQIVKLNDINSDLVKIQNTFTTLLEQPTIINTSKPRYLKYAAGGLFFGFFLALLGSFCSAIWFHYRCHRIGK